MSDLADHGEGLYHRAYTLKEHEVKDFYAQWASTYDSELDVKGYAMPERCAAAITRHVPDTESAILDIGCGTGLLGARLAAAGYSAIDGIDYSDAMLEVAGASGAYRSLANVDVNEALDIADDAYAVVAAVGVFSFGHITPDALDEMIRILRPGGHLIVGVNEVYVEEGSLTAKLDTLKATGTLAELEGEYGDHVVASGVNGYVYVLQPPAD